MSVAQEMGQFVKRTIFFLLALQIISAVAIACSICTSLSPTLCDEMTAAELAIIARYEQTPEVGPGVDDPDAYKSTFQIDEVLKGTIDLHEEGVARVLFFPGKTARAGDHYLMHGNRIESDEGGELVIRWLTPIAVTDEAMHYLRRMWEIPENDVSRLQFATPYLNSPDPMLRRDAFDEFGKAPYELLEELGPELDKNNLIEKIESTDTSSNLKKLYFTLLTICGTKSELPFIVSQIEKEKSSASESLPALIACYVSLAGEAGLPFIEETYLSKEGADYERRAGAAITALRFHGQEASVIERDKIVEVFHHMLKRPTLGARILSDLARWEDWSVVDRVAEIFVEAKGDGLWVREPAARYLLACPNNDAVQQIGRLEKIDELAIRNARRFTFPPTMSSSAPAASPRTGVQGQASVLRDSQSAVSTGGPEEKPNREESAEASISRSGWQYLVWLAVASLFVVLLGWTLLKRRKQTI